MENIKTIDIQAKEWFDKINGNSYFAGTITINFAEPSEVRFNLPFQYGYGSQYETEAMNTMVEKGIITDAEAYTSGGYESLWRYCQRKGIDYRHSKKENCKKAELMNYKE